MGAGDCWNRLALLGSGKGCVGIPPPLCSFLLVLLLLAWQGLAPVFVESTTMRLIHPSGIPRSDARAAVKLPEEKLAKEVQTGMFRVNELVSAGAAMGANVGSSARQLLRTYGTFCIVHDNGKLTRKFTYTPVGTGVDSSVGVRVSTSEGLAVGS